MSKLRTHPTDSVLNDFLLGKLPDPEAAEVESHLAECPECQQRAAASRVGDTLVELLAAAGTKADAERGAAPPLTLSGGETPSLFAATQAWTGSASPDEATPAALAAHPKYRVVRRLGVGGMGSVWLAEHAVMNRPVAVKVIRPELLARPGAAGRFLREVRAAAKLHHPNIVTAYDAEQVGDSCLLVMEYVDGETLGERVKAGPLPVEEACRAARDAARGLAHAHAAGLVHSDVKPHNLIRAADGTVKVLDFGLASVVAGDAAVRAADGLTGAGIVAGTPDYIAPEQIADPHAADARADIYGLGCTLYHLLAGRVSFPKGTVAEKLAAQERQMPAPIPDLPPDLAAILAKMMAKRPEDRYQSAEEVVAALEQFCEAWRAGSASPPRPGWRRWLVAAGLLFALFAMAAAGVVFKIHRGNQEITIQTDDPDIEVVMKRNGELVRIIDRKSGQVWEYDALMNQIGLADTPDGLTLTLPEGGSVVMKRNGKDVFTVARVSKPEAVEKVGEVRRFIGFEAGDWVTRAIFSPDGHRVVAVCNDLRVWDAASGKPLAVMGGRKEFGWGLALSPDGKTAYWSVDSGVVRIFDLEAAKEVGRLNAPVRGPSSVRLSADGERILITCNHARKHRLCEASGGKVLGEFEGCRWAALSPNGARVALAREKRVVLWDVASGQEAGGFDTDLKQLEAVQFSSDGSLLATTGFLAEGNAVVQLWDVVTGKRRASFKVPHDPKTPMTPLDISPDGSRVLTGTDTSGVKLDPPVILWDVATGKEVCRFAGPETGVFSLTFSPDGRSALVNGPDGTVRLLRLPYPPPAKKP
jgi:serine/threonine protein kinase